MKNRKLRKIETLCRHVLKHLPDSSSLKRTLLEGICAALPAENGLRVEAGMMIHHMDQFDKVQARLVFDGDGHHNGGDGK